MDRIQKQSALALLIEQFGDVTLATDAYTLAEEDWYDNSHAHMDGQPRPCFNFDYPLSQWLDDEEQALHSSYGYWRELERQEAIEALRQQRKMRNTYPNWQDIPLDYLYAYYTGFTFSSSAGFYFYTPPLLMWMFKQDELNDWQQQHLDTVFNSWAFNITYSSQQYDLNRKLRNFSDKQLYTLIVLLKLLPNLENNISEITMVLANYRCSRLTT
ncbi:DUF6714 family protein [Acinetobacter sp.]|uniref:DUF6714 family protein n=1 Tax=Acinetobacter sp. TaxID=472 RepID=UPI002FD8B544